MACPSASPLPSPAEQAKCEKSPCNQWLIQRMLCATRGWIALSYEGNPADSPRHMGKESGLDHSVRSLNPMMRVKEARGATCWC